MKFVQYTLTKDASLFFIDDSQVQEFTNLFHEHCHDLEFEKGLLNEKDVIHNCLNLWLMMRHLSKDVMESMEKTMYYTGDFLIFDAIRKNKFFQQIKNTLVDDQIRQCQVASCLANQLNVWLYEKVGSLKSLTLFNDPNQTYFLLHRNAHLWENRDFLDEVAMYTKRVTNALADRERFVQIFKHVFQQLDQFEVQEEKI